MTTRRLILLALAVALAARVAVEGGAVGADECGTDSTSRLAPCIVLPGVAPLEGAGECGTSSADRIFLRMAPCFPAMDDPEAPVSASCCSVVHTLMRSPSCLCAVFQSNSARGAGIKLEIAVTIPKRCNIADRPIGYKCGDYTMP